MIFFEKMYFVKTNNVEYMKFSENLIKVCRDNIEK